MKDLGLSVDKEGKVKVEKPAPEPGKDLKSDAIDTSAAAKPAPSTPLPGSSPVRPSGITPPKKPSTAKTIGGAAVGGAIIGAGVSALSGDDTPKADAKPATPSKSVNFLDPTPIEKQKVDLKPTPANQIPSDVVLGGPTKLPNDVKSVPMAPKSAAKPAAAPKVADAEPEDKHAKSKAMFQAHNDAVARGDDSPAAFFAADAQRQRELGKKAPNDFSDSGIGKSIENSAANKWMNKTFGGKSVSESSLIDSFLKSDPSKNLFSEAKKAKKDWDKDGKIESDKDEVWGSRFAAAKKAGKMDEELKGDQDKIDANHNNKVDAQDFKILRGKKKMEEATSSDPDFAAPRPDGSKKPDDIQYKPEDKKPEDKVPLPPKRPSGLKEAYLKILRGE
jgi:hypothetical protein